ncbi:MAG: HPr family phosphocarrier protein [Candidatus Omnitrophica bacterium]|nr:HPr family phosphocarrier protein [Candidatus Omnitrophota bacterium]
MLRKRLQIRNHQGLHARPAALFVKVAKQFKSTVRLKKGRNVVDGKSIMGVLTLAAERGSPIELMVQGPDAKEALASLEQLLSHRDLPTVVSILRHS